MGYHIELNALLKLPDDIDSSSLKEGEKLHIVKDGEHLYLLHKPLDFCTSTYQYKGKVIIRKLTLEKNKTTIEAEILKLFTKEESDIFSANFITDFS